jgi:large subunit ribosomal protein L25
LYQEYKVADFTIKASARNITGKKVNTLRNKGIVPGTIYGPKAEPLTVQFDYRELELTLKNAGSTNIVGVQVGDLNIDVLARDVQRDVLKGTIIHVDLFAVDPNSKIRAEIPVVLTGESPVIASRKAILMAGTSTIRIEVLPNDLVNRIEVDLSALTTIGSTIYVKDLKVSDKITILNDGDEIVAKAIQTGAQRAAADREAAAANA